MAIVAGATLAAVAAYPAASQGTGDAAENWARIAACARIDPLAERQACVDAVFRATGLLDRAREVTQQREAFGQPPPRDRPRPAAPPSVAAIASAAPAAQPAPPPPLDRIATTISRAFDPGNRLMVIITAEGHVWQQSESKDLGLPPRAGTAFSVEQGALGSYNCRIGTGRTFRCRRHD